MPKITLRNVTKRWNNFYAVENLDLDIEDNAFVTLLGPSGCGKTTTLRMIAGLETPTSGQIKIGDQIVFDSERGINIPANKRKVGFLFQNYALWPNMTVYQNIVFGLKNVKELMPVYDFTLKANKQIIDVLANPEKIVEVINDCKDKTGKIDKNRACIKLIDGYTISMFSAKFIYDLGLHTSVDCKNQAEIAIARLKEDNEKIIAKYNAKGLDIDEECKVLKNGQVVEEVRVLDKEEIDLLVRHVARIVKVQMFMERYPAELSGGQQQRVAIARTLAPGPKVLFMDEPLSNLDAKLRLEMRYELQRLHIETGSTFVYVTHDQMEAMTLATRICLINNGVLQQYEPPLDVYNHPNNTFVADFVGNPSINFIEASGKQNDDGKIEMNALNGQVIKFVPNEDFNLEAWYKERDEKAAKAKQELQEKLADKHYVEKGNKDEVFKYNIIKVNDDEDALKKEYIPVNGDFVLGIRPEFIQIEDEGALNAEIFGAMPTGMESTLKLNVNGNLLTAVIFGGVTYKLGTKVKINFTGNTICLFDRVSGKAISYGSLEL